MNKDEALKLALKALESLRPEGFFNEAITAIKEALAQPEQEPVAWMDSDGDVLSASIVDGTGLRNIPLYTSPPQRTWQGLTDKEVDECFEFIIEDSTQAVRFYRATEAKLKEKNFD